MRFRKATVADAPVLRQWDEEPHVIACDPESDWNWEEDLARDPTWRESIMAEVDGRPIGFIQIIDPREEDSHYWGDCPANLRALDVWIGEPEFLGKGYGKLMMREALRRCFATPEVEAVLIDPLASNRDAIRFYRRLGFVFVEQRWFGGDHCEVHRLDRAAWAEVD